MPLNGPEHIPPPTRVMRKMIKRVYCLGVEIKIPVQQGVDLGLQGSRLPFYSHGEKIKKKI